MPAERGTSADDPRCAPRMRRLQIRVSVDEHMQDLYAWLLAMPATVRGRELVAQARLARGMSGAGRVIAPVSLPLRSAASVSGDAAEASVAGGPGALAQEAVEQACARLEVEFLAAVPPAA